MLDLFLTFDIKNIQKRHNLNNSAVLKYAFGRVSWLHLLKNLQIIDWIRWLMIIVAMTSRAMKLLNHKEMHLLKNLLLNFTAATAML